MKVYISGPITGFPNFMENFKKVEEELKSKGYEVVNPAKVNAMLPDGTSYQEYMEMSLTMLRMCDTIYMMKGWELSKGATCEYAYALCMGKTVIGDEEENKAKNLDAFTPYVDNLQIEVAEWDRKLTNLLASLPEQSKERFATLRILTKLSKVKHAVSDLKNVIS